MPLISNTQYESSKLTVANEIMLAVCILFIGLFGYTIYKGFFNNVDYVTTTRIGVLINEWLVVSKPLLFFVPVIYVVIRKLCYKIGLAKSVALICTIAFMFTVPECLHRLEGWQPLFHIVNDLPISEVKYSRQSASISRPALMSIKFTLPEEQFETMQSIMTDRIQTEQLRNSVVIYFDIYKQTSDGRQLSPYHYDLSKYEGIIVGKLYL